MQFGNYSDNEIPKQKIEGYKVNSHGYRCAEFSPLPAGKKNAVVLGCSHTFGVGLEEDQHWVYHISQHNTDRIRWWNLGTPGASGDTVVRILQGTEEVLFPKLILIMWPSVTRRENFGDVDTYKYETSETDWHNFQRNLFLSEKFAKYNNAKIWHCFAQDDPKDYVADAKNCWTKTNLKNCYPKWSRIKSNKKDREQISEIDKAKDGLHYGPKHHKTFAEDFLHKFGNNIN